MTELLSFPVYDGALAAYGGAEGLAACCAALHLDGLEVVWGDDSPPQVVPREAVVGYHLAFWPDWVDFWRGDVRALDARFGGRAVWQAFYGGDGPEALVRAWRADLTRGLALGAQYFVFHVSDASIEEQFLYRWRHSGTEVADAALEAVAAMTEGLSLPAPILFENQWWPGLTLHEPAVAARLLERARVPCGLLLDTGHTLNTAPALWTEEEGAAFLCRLLDGMGALAREIAGVHLHRSLSGGYVRAHTGRLPHDLAADYLTRYAQNYAHVLRIDRHEPWQTPAVRQVLARLSPRWLVHELAGAGPAARAAAVRTQRRALGLL